LQSAPFLRIGTRGSPLALVQAHLVRKLVAKTNGVDEADIEVQPITTSGDRLGEAPLAEVGGKGLFSKEIEAALEAGTIDIGVHSAKDMATTLPGGLVLAALLEREDVRDAFVSLSARALAELPAGAKVGSSSIRRAAQVLRQRPDVMIVPFRGNVDTRLRKLRDGVADATLLAVAGLRRLDREAEVTEYLDPARFPPAPAQGAIAIESRAGDARTIGIVAPLNHAPTARTVTAERALLRELDGSCRTAIGVLTNLANGTISVKGEILAPSGQNWVEAEQAGSAADAEAIGAELGRKLRAMAGPTLLAALAAAN
jgi:hydroxymethylbilane synthase